PVSERYTWAMRLAHTLTLAIAAIAPFAGCGSSPPREEPSAAPAPPRTSASTSISRGAAIVSALRASQFARDRPRAFAHLRRAIDQAPDRKELVWLAIRLCPDVPRCDPAVYEARLRKLDPGNGVVWMGPLARAQGRGDDAAATQILEALSRETRFDVY